MKKLVKIKAYSEARTGQTKTSNQPWELRDVVVEWIEEGNGGQFEQSACISVGGQLDVDMLDAAIRDARLVECSIYLRHTVYNGRYFTNIKGYLPSEFTKK